MSLREVRIHAEHRGDLRRVCKVLFTANDFSIYLVPYAAGGRYFYGSRSFGEREIEQTFDFTEQLTSEEVPKLSIHESGQVHVGTGGERAGPLHVGPLADLAGQHVATITADAFDGLPRYDGPLATSGSRIDHVIPAEPGVGSGRLAVYVSGTGSTSSSPVQGVPSRSTLGSLRSLRIGPETRTDVG